MANKQLERALNISDASPLISRVLATCSSSSGVATIPDFLEAVERVASKERQLSSASAWRTAARLGSKDRTVAAPDGEAPSAASSGLKAAFREARDLRASIGGRDRFIGLRHVLAAIMTSRTRSIVGELRTYLEESRVPAKTFRDALLRDILLAPEPHEDLAVWQRLFANPGPREASPTSPPEELSPPELESVAQDHVSPPPGEPPAAEPLAMVEAEHGFSRDMRDPPNPLASGPRARTHVFAITGADDPNDPELRDRTGADREAEAFAMLATARDFTPPVAFGVFGEWGAGKSFFLRLIMDHVARLSSEADDQSPFHKDVVPIVFNAWHYAETNLWASLVDHIFSKLDQWSAAEEPTSSLLDNLSSSRSFTFEAAEAVIETRREQHAAAALLTQAVAEQVSAEQSAVTRLGEITTAAWNTIWVQAADEEGRKEKVESAARQLGLSEATTSVEGAVNALKQLDEEIAGVGFIRGPFLRMATSAGVLAFCAIGILVLPPLIAWGTNALAGPAAALIAAVSGLAAPLALAAAWVRVNATKAVGHIRKLRPFVEAAQTEIRGRKERELEPQRQVLADKTAVADEARARLQVATDRLAQASSDYAAGTGRARLLSFVRERVATDSYGKHLSFVATIRRDFEALSSLMTDASVTDVEAETAASRHSKAVEELIARSADLLTREETERLRATTKPDVNPGRGFQRIILYIDDLDRCPPEKVIEVLQAIHLLLAFKLFVVFVAVDVRWLENALTKEYKNAFTADALHSSATPYDYLEKIFQIPYWVRKLTPISVAAVLADRLATSVGNDENETSPANQEDIAPPEIDGREPQADIIPDTGAPEPSLDGEIERPEALRITRAEADYMRELAPALNVSPRRVLRFLNTYSLIKASLPPDGRERLETGFYGPVLSLLAIAVLDDKTAGLLFRQFVTAGSVSELPPLDPNGPLNGEVARALAALPSDVVIADLREASNLVMRFTFCGDLH